MFPIRDENPTATVPAVTVLLIAVTGAVWWYVQGAGMSMQALERSICAYGAIPAEVTGREVSASETPCALGGLTWEAVPASMFLHGGWMHLLGNMWFLWLFGNNIEDAMGHVRFLVFYLVTGVAAAAAHIASDPGSGVPMVGASGAISGVMGAYLVLYPRARVDTLFLFIVFVRVIPLPAWLMLGYWILLQVLASTAAPQGGGGVAYLAHIGGFAAGVVLVFPFRDPDRIGRARRGRRRSGWWA